MQSNLKKAQKHIQRATDLLGFGSPQSEWQCDGNITTKEFFYKDINRDEVKFVRQMNKEEMTIKFEKETYTFKWPVYFCESAQMDLVQGRKAPVLLISRKDYTHLCDIAKRKPILINKKNVLIGGLPQVPGPANWYAMWMFGNVLKEIDGLKQIDVPVIQMAGEFNITEDELAELKMGTSLKKKIMDIFPQKYKESNRIAELWDLHITQNMKISWLYNDVMFCPAVTMDYFGVDRPFGSENKQLMRNKLVQSLFKNCNIFSFFQFRPLLWGLVLYATVSEGSAEILRPERFAKMLEDSTSRKSIVAALHIVCETDHAKRKIDSWVKSYQNSADKFTSFFENQKSLGLKPFQFV